MLEPATASFAHHKIGLGAACQIFDLSNACLGFLNGLVTLGAMIDSGQIKCGMGVAGGEGWALAGPTGGRPSCAPPSPKQNKPVFPHLPNSVRGRAHRQVPTEPTPA